MLKQILEDLAKLVVVNSMVLVQEQNKKDQA